jgi:hypothetical protein
MTMQCLRGGSIMRTAPPLLWSIGQCLRAPSSSLPDEHAHDWCKGISVDLAHRIV